MPDGKVLAGGGMGSAYPASYSSNAGVLFTLLSVGLSGHGNEHVIFDVDFKNNQFIYMGDDAAGGVLGTVYRNTLPSFTKWNDNDMMSVANGASGIDWNGILGVTGLVNLPPLSIHRTPSASSAWYRPGPALHPMAPFLTARLSMPHMTTSHTRTA